MKNYAPNNHKTIVIDPNTQEPDRQIAKLIKIIILKENPPDNLTPMFETRETDSGKVIISFPTLRLQDKSKPASAKQVELLYCPQKQAVLPRNNNEVVKKAVWKHINKNNELKLKLTKIAQNVLQEKPLYISKALPGSDEFKHQKPQIPAE